MSLSNENSRVGTWRPSQEGPSAAWCPGSRCCHAPSPELSFYSWCRPWWGVGGQSRASPGLRGAEWWRGAPVPTFLIWLETEPPQLGCPGYHFCCFNRACELGSLLSSPPGHRYFYQTDRSSVSLRCLRPRCAWLTGENCSQTIHSHENRPLMSGMCPPSLPTRRSGLSSVNSLYHVDFCITAGLFFARSLCLWWW